MVNRAKKTWLIILGLAVMLFSVVLPATGMEIAADGQDHLSSAQIIQQDTSILTYGRELENTPVTIRSVLQLSKDWEQSDNEGFHLVKLGENSLVWVVDRSGWWPTWQLQLQTAKGTTTLSKPTPAKGHRYETILSVDPATGVLAVVVKDLTTNERVYGGSFQLEPFTESLQPGVATLSQKQASAEKSAFVELVSYEGFLPISTDWRIGATIGEDGTFFLQAKFDVTGEPMARVVVPDLPLTGEYRLSIKAENSQEILANLQPVKGTSLVPLAVDALPIGKSTLTLEYLEDGEVLLSAAQDIVLGNLTYKFSQIFTNQAAGVLQGTLELSSAGSIPEFGVSVHAAISEVIWNEQKKKYDEVPYSDGVLVLSQKVAITPESNRTDVNFSLPLPPKVGTWKVRFTPTASLNLRTEVVRNEVLFTSYASAVAVDPEKPFTIAVLPDTQYYAQDYPTIFTRQTQWLAEKAAERNIALMLHVGDITNNNKSFEWERAESSLGLLNGVIPYVLAVGNHDFRSNGPEKGHEDSVINHYFPAKSFPNLAGTFVADRVENSYHLHTLAGTDYLILSLEFAPRDEVLDWANKVVAAHPERKVIVVTHNYTWRDGRRVSPGAKEAVDFAPHSSKNDGVDMWNKFVRKHSNILLVLSGHHGMTMIPWQMARGDHGNKVYELLIDFQWEDNGGNGWLALMEFQPDGRVKIETYSPFLGQYKTDGETFQFKNSFTIEL